MRYTVRIIVCFVLSAAIVVISALLFLKEQHFYSILLFILAAVILWLSYRMFVKQNKAFYRFVEDVRYRDFTRSYASHKGSYETRKQHAAFNELNTAYRSISAERESNVLYLQRILELINTGILTYDINNGDITWMNDAFRQLFNIPQIKNVEWISKRHPYLYNALNGVEIGESKVIEVPIGLNSVKVLANLSGFQSEGKTYKLFALQNRHFRRNRIYSMETLAERNDP